jgi:hypothetical protein
VKVKTRELEGMLLDWMVWACAGGAVAYPKMQGQAFVRAWRGGSTKYLHPSTDWGQGGPIIDRELICIDAGDGQFPEARRWEAHLAANAPVLAHMEINGPTALVAAMRCYVHSKLGNEVDVPEELR